MQFKLTDKAKLSILLAGIEGDWIDGWWEYITGYKGIAKPVGNKRFFMNVYKEDIAEVKDENS